MSSNSLTDTLPARRLSTRICRKQRLQSAPLLRYTGKRGSTLGGSNSMRLNVLCVCLLAAGCGSGTPDTSPDLWKRVGGSDWPAFLGPNHDGTSPERGILTTWPKEGLRIVWETQVGLGYPPPVVSKGRLYHFDRFGDENRLTCRNAETGKLLWKFEFATDYDDIYGYSPGPRACPVADDDRVYCLGPDGKLFCVNAVTGKEIWKADTQAAFPFHQNFFGVGSVPLVDGDLLIVPVGGSPDAKGKASRPLDLRVAKGNGTGIVAFDKKTGQVRYKSSNELASYSSP